MDHCVKVTWSIKTQVLDPCPDTLMLEWAQESILTMSHVVFVYT